MNGTMNSMWSMVREGYKLLHDIRAHVGMFPCGTEGMIYLENRPFYPYLKNNEPARENLNVQVSQSPGVNTLQVMEANQVDMALPTVVGHSQIESGLNDTVEKEFNGGGR